MGGALRATAIGFVSLFSRLPPHSVNMKANNRAMIRIRAIPFCQVSKQGTRREGSPEMAAGSIRKEVISLGLQIIPAFVFADFYPNRLPLFADIIVLWVSFDVCNRRLFEVFESRPADRLNAAVAI